MKYLFSLYSWIILIIYLPLFFIGFLSLSFVFSFDRMDGWMKFFVKLLLKLLFIRVKTENIETLDKNKAYIFMPNHVSFADPFVLFAYLPNILKGVEIAHHFKWPVYGYFMKKFGQIPIDQSSVSKSLNSMRAAQEYIKNGHSIIIFPEGQRTITGEINQFKRLPFLMAQEAEVDIVPIALSGLHKIMPAGSPFIRPGKVTINIGEIIHYQEIHNRGSRAVCKFTQDQIAEMRIAP